MLVIWYSLSLHVREEPPSLVSPLRIVDERGAVRHRPGPGHRHWLASVVSEGEDGVEVESQLGEGEEDHHQGGGAAGELLHVGEHPGHALEGRLLLGAQAVVLYDLCNKQSSQLRPFHDVTETNIGIDRQIISIQPCCHRFR